MPKIVIHRPGGSVLSLSTPRTRSNDGLHVFLHRATFARDDEGAYLRPGSHKPETRAKQTPINDAIDCEKCKGTGSVGTNDCTECKGTGKTHA